MNRFDYNPPNTRQRIAARRKQNRTTRRSGSSVKPGPRRIADSWLSSGRLLSLVVFLGALGALLYLFTAPQFTVQNVRIQGAQVISQDDIADLADARNQPIWHVDTQQIVAQLTTSAYIEYASAYVTLPDQLTISVSERRPEVRWQVGGQQFLVDASGRVLGIDGSAPLTNTLVIMDNSNRVLEPNDRVELDAVQLGQALALRLPGELNLTPMQITWQPDTGIFVTLTDNRTIIFGTSERLDEKLAMLQILLSDGTAFGYLDLRSHTPFYRSDGNVIPLPEQN